jgi:hypothetical protein
MLNQKLINGCGTIRLNYWIVAIGGVLVQKKVSASNIYSFANIYVRFSDLGGCGVLRFYNKTTICIDQTFCTNQYRAFCEI